MIENKIKEIQEYFKEKILKWEFEVDNAHITITLKVDWKYFFTFHFQDYNSRVSQWSDIWDENSFKLNLSEEEEKQIYKKLLDSSVIQQAIETVWRENKMRQYEKLKKELGL